MTAVFADEMTGADIIWTALVMTLTTFLGAGLAVRPSRATTSTVLLSIGAAAPALAWFWMTPTYLFSATIAITAIATGQAACPIRTAS